MCSKKDAEDIHYDELIAGLNKLEEGVRVSAFTVDNFLLDLDIKLHGDIFIKGLVEDIEVISLHNYLIII